MTEPDLLSGPAASLALEPSTPPPPPQRVASLVALAVTVVSALILLLATPLWLRATASMALAILVPGMLVTLLALGAGRSAEGWLERTLVAGGVGFALAIILLLAAGMAPGGVEKNWLIGLFVVVDGLLIVANFFDRRPAPEDRSRFDRRLWVGLAIVIVLAGVLRFTHLGYSEFQGDESRVMLRAGEVLAGMENALLVHQKGPGEILLGATFYGLDGWVTEAAARVPFAIANLWAVAAFFLLAWRVAGPQGGLAAGVLFALDGYLIAFGRIVQYQSIVILAALLALILLEGAARSRERLFGRFLIVGLLLGAGLLAHYDIVTVAIPALWLLWRASGGPAGWRRILAATASAAAVALIVAAFFYIPYVRYPGFASTFRYVTQDRLGSTWPYNNLVDVTQRTMLYSSSYYVLFIVLVTLGSLVSAYRRAWGWVAAIVALGVTLAAGAAAWSGAGWMTLAGRDWTGLVLALPLLGVCLLPGLRPGERMAWLWFAPLCAGALFLIAQPDTHVYIFFIPWILVVGVALQRMWEWVPRMGEAARPILAATGAALAILFAIYPWLMFADAPAERLRTWHENRPVAYWYPWDLPPERGIFGFPLRNGWKTVAIAFADGDLKGGFDYNTRMETANWYTRSQGQCPADGRYWILTDTVEPNDDDRLAEKRAAIENAYGLAATAVVGGVDRLRVYDSQMVGASMENARRWPLDEISHRFDQLTATIAPSRPGRVREAMPQTAFDARVGDAIRLTGYTLDSPVVAPGAQLPITLTWAIDAPVYNSYTVFLHVVDPATNGKVGQRDALPVCGQNQTWQWNPGDVIEDPYTIPIAPDAAPGTYRLYVGMYDLNTGERLPVLGPDGAPLSDFVDLAAITVQ